MARDDIVTVDAVRTRLRAAHAAIGGQGRFALTYSLSCSLSCPQSGGEVGGEEFYLTHWFRPGPYALEDCRAVGCGTLGDCLDALDRYVAGLSALTRSPARIRQSAH
jgi:hypothetical protein